MNATDIDPETIPWRIILFASTMMTIWPYKTSV